MLDVYPKSSLATPGVDYIHPDHVVMIAIAAGSLACIMSVHCLGGLGMSETCQDTSDTMTYDVDGVYIRRRLLAR
jgi:hypothetical protein